MREEVESADEEEELLQERLSMLKKLGLVVEG